MTPAQLTTLLAIIDEGSFESAALELGISPSAVSQRIKALESNVGRVVVRRTTPATATEAGEVLVQAARRMALVQAEAAAELTDRLDRVPLTVAVNADTLATWFKPVLRDAAGWPGTALRLRLEEEERTRALLRRGDVMAAVTRHAAPVSGCEVVELGTVRYIAAASPELRLNYTTHEGLDWAHMPALRFGPNDLLQDEDLGGRLAPGERRARPVSYIPSSEGFVDAAVAGLGWALFPEKQIQPHLKSGELVRLDDLVTEVHLYWQHWRLQSTLLDRLTRSVVRAARGTE